MNLTTGQRNILSQCKGHHGPAYSITLIALSINKSQKPGNTHSATLIIKAATFTHAFSTIKNTRLIRIIIRNGGYLFFNSDNIPWLRQTD